MTRMWALTLAGVVLMAGSRTAPAIAGSWTHYGGDPGGSRYSTAAEINRANVGGLREIWRYSTGEFDPKDPRTQKGAYEATPILVEGRLIFTSPYARVFALDPATGVELWRYDAKLELSHRYAEVANRGAAAWIGARASEKQCRIRIFFGTLDGRLIALDGETGRPCTDFGTAGAVDLKRDARPTGQLGQYTVTSPPVVIGDIVISGSAIGDNRGVELELGIVRGFDVRTGAELWRWDPIPRDVADPAHGHWRSAQAKRTGGANAWGPLSVDMARNLVFVPTGSASPDYYGGERIGDNRYANSLVALRATTGEIVWWRQLVHHDLWDYDLPAQPTLVDLVRDGVAIPAVIQPTKMGLLFVFHRETGEPLFPIDERPVPQTDVPGEQTWPTQPFPRGVPPLVRTGAVTPDEAWGLTPWDRSRCRELISRYRSEGIFTPPSLRGSINFPGPAGGSNWSGVSFHPARQVVVANVMELPYVVTLAPVETLDKWRASGNFPNSEFAPQRGTPYGMRRELLASPFDIPCTPPPWGSIVALDLKAGSILWRKPLGTTEGRAPYAFEFGMPNVGGPLLTAGDLIFIAATEDARFRALDIDTGEQLWQTRLPAGGLATPMTYTIGGQQYVVIVAGGHARTDSPLGVYVVAFALHGTGEVVPPPNRTFWLTVTLASVMTATILLLLYWRRRRKWRG